MWKILDIHERPHDLARVCRRGDYGSFMDLATSPIRALCVFVMRVQIFASLQDMPLFSLGVRSGLSNSPFPEYHRATGSTSDWADSSPPLVGETAADPPTGNQHVLGLFSPLHRTQNNWLSGQWRNYWRDNSPRVIEGVADSTVTDGITGPVVTEGATGPMVIDGLLAPEVCETGVVFCNAQGVTAVSGATPIPCVSETKWVSAI